MDGLHVLDLALFTAGTFAAAFVTGLAGFAFAIVAAAVWLHFLTPGQAAPLIVAFALIVQGVSVWKLRAAIKVSRILPLVIGSAIGVPLGAALLQWTPAAYMRMAIGVLLVAFALYNWFRPDSAVASRAGPIADGAAGIVNGVIGGATGLAGIAGVVWCNLRGWSPAEQRAVFQPVGVATFVMIALWLGGTGMIGGATVPLFLLGLPALALGTWAGLKSFGRLNDAGFRRIVLGLLLLSGLSLLFRIGAARAEELRVWSGGAMRAAVQELVPAFERDSGHKLVVAYGTVAKVAEQIAKGEPVDVAIVTKPVIDKLAASGLIGAASAVLLARVPIGLAVRRGAPHPAIATADAVEEALRAAKFVTYGDPGIGDAAGVHLAKVLEARGLAAELKPKTRLISPGPGQSGAQYLTGLFERGETELAMAPISVLSETTGIDIVGLLPAELQSPDLAFFAAIPSTCRHRAEAKAFIDFLTTAPARIVYQAKGMEPG